MRIRLSFLIALLALVFSACGNVEEPASTSDTSTSTTATIPTSTSAPSDSAPSANVSIEDPWTDESLATVSETIDHWEQVWLAQADYPYRMTVLHDGDPVYHSDWDADGNMVSENFINEVEHRRTDPRSVEEFFDDHRTIVSLFADGTITRGQDAFHNFYFDPETGAPAGIDCGDEVALCVRINVEITPL